MPTSRPRSRSIRRSAPWRRASTSWWRRPAGAPSDDNDALATQWFIVSDLGLTAFSGNDGVHVFVHSLATAQPKGAIEVRLLSRSNEVLATTPHRATPAICGSKPASRAARARWRRRSSIATDARGDYAFLSLKAPAFDLTDRGVSGRVVPAGLDAFVYTERGVYRSGETVQVTALLRDGAGRWQRSARRSRSWSSGRTASNIAAACCPIRASAAARSALPLVASAPTGTWRVRAFTDPKRPPVGEATFMVEDYVPDRLEFELASQAKGVSRTTPAEITVDGRYLYGAPAAKLELEGEMVIAAAAERAGFARLPLRHCPTSGSRPSGSRSKTCRRPTPTARRAFSVALDKLPTTSRPLEAQIIVRMAEAGGRAVERKLALPVTPTAPMIGVKPLFSGRSLGEGENATFDVIMVGARRHARCAQAGLRYELLKVETRYQWYRRDGVWDFEPVKIHAARRRRPARRRRRQAGAHLGCRCSGAAIGSKCRPATATAR